MFEIFRKLNQNPIYIKECQVRERTRKKQKPDLVTILIYLLYPVGLMIAVLSVVDIDNTTIGSIYLCINSFPYLIIVLLDLCFCFKAVSHSWNSLSSEKEMMTYDNLLSTLLTPGEIIKGKFWSLFVPIAKEVLDFIPLFILLVLTHGIQFTSILLAVPFILIHVAFFTILGIYVSSRFKSTVESRNMGNRVLINYLGGTIVFAVFLSLFNIERTVFPFNFNDFDGNIPGFLPSFIILSINPVANIFAIFRTGNYVLWNETGNLLVFSIYLITAIILYFVIGKILVNKMSDQIAVSLE